jgi:capsular exopolysaccharide synthesis family protein
VKATSEIPPSEPAQSDEQVLPLVELWRIVRTNLWLILVTACVVLASAVFFTLGQRKIYEARAVLQIDPAPPQPLGRDVQAVVAMGADSYWTQKEYLETQYRVLQGRRLAADVVRTLRLNQDGAFLANLPAGAKGAAADAPVEAAAAALLGRLMVEPVKSSRLVRVALQDADPERARKILGALLDAYLQRNVDDAVGSANSAAEWLRAQVVNLKADLEKSELALHDYKTEKRLLSASLDDQSNMLRDEMKQLNEAVTTVRTRREHLLSRSRELAKVNSDDPVNIPATELLESGVLSNFRGSYVAAKGALSALIKGGKGANHPEARSAEAHVAATREALVREVKNIRGAVDGDLTAATREANGLAQLFESAKQRALDLNLLEIDVRRLERTKANNEKLYSLVLERSKETDLTSMLRFNNIRVVEDPLAGGPVKPRVPTNLALGLFGGLVLGLAAAFVKESSDRTLKVPDEVDRVLQAPLLGVLPLAPGVSTGSRRRAPRAPSPVELLAHDQPHSNLAEAARGVRTNLMFMSPDTPYRSLLVTSATPGEGKTTVACSIAIAMAQAGQRVLLVDCDLRRPRLHRVFARPNDLGVTGATLDPARLNVEELATVIPNLSVLPVGPHVPNPAELLQTEKFRSLFERMLASFDRVVIDSPPVSVVSDAAILSQRTDGVVFVARSSKTHRDAARKAVRALRSVGGNVAGVVLNALDLKRQGYSEYYYYYYRYYRYGEDGRDASA